MIRTNHTTHVNCINNDTPKADLNHTRLWIITTKSLLFDNTHFAILMLLPSDILSLRETWVLFLRATISARLNFPRLLISSGCPSKERVSFHHHVSDFTRQDPCSDRRVTKFYSCPQQHRCCHLIILSWSLS